MKTRQGFVSNSSSSSFVLIVDKKAWEDKFKDLNEDQKKTVEIYTGSNEKEEFRETLIFNWPGGDAAEWIWDEMRGAFEDSKQDEMTDWWDEFTEQFGKEGNGKLMNFDS